MNPSLATTIPLSGCRLIEAGAGTGKTWTIASIAARLVATSDGPTGQPLDVQDILVLTFTRAAARELVDRIRRRLLECQAALEGTWPADRPMDDLQQHLLDRLDNLHARAQAAWRLARAAASMDTACVSTIDAWVQKMLREEVAPVGGEPLGEIAEDDRRWIRLAVLDYWRQQVYPLDDEAMDLLATAHEHVDSLLTWLAPTLGGSGEVPAAPSEDLQSVLSCLRADQQARLAELKRLWAPHGQCMRQWFDAAWSQKKPPIHGGKLRRANVEPLLQRLQAWTAGTAHRIEGLSHGEISATALNLLPSGLLAAHLDGARPAHAPEWSIALEQLLHQVRAVPVVEQVLGPHARAWVRQRLDQLKQGAQTWSFNDLLARLSRALKADPSCAERLRRTFPVTLIDEFQDTSVEQFEVFDLIYRLSENREGTALLMIGDPKQSIYRFRGADIASYLAARRLSAERVHTLSVNHRSTQGLVVAVNHLFERGQSRPEGAFLHGHEIPFVAAQAGRTIAPLGRPGSQPGGCGPDLPVLRAWTEPTVRGSAPSRELDAARAADRLAALLRPSAALLPTRPLAPGDCCVLVRSGVEAAAMRRALAARGLPSAYLSDQELVFQAEEALEVLDLLRALQQPHDPAWARRVWASRMMGLTWDGQRRQATDDALWNGRLDRLAHAQRLWREHGIQAALRRFIQEEGIVSRALADRHGGERRLTNILHLAEWLEESSQEAGSPAALIDRLARAIEEAQADPKARRVGGSGQIVRLESEADVVQIVTIHKAKGLEYPVVFLPFAGAVSRESREDDAFALEAPAAGTSYPEDLAERQEDVRLLYVALTRAVHQLWIGACPRATQAGQASRWARSALGHLVSGADRTGEQVVEDLKGFFAELGHLGVDAQLEVLPADEVVTAAPDQPPQVAASPVLDPPLTLTAPIDRRWRISSYSSMVRDAVREGGSEVPDWGSMRWDEPAESQPVCGAPPAAGGPDEESGEVWHGLPSSAELGQFMHELLERCALDGFDLEGHPTLRHELRDAVLRSPWADHEASVILWLERVLQHRLTPWGVSLRGLEHPRAELEFWLPLQTLDVSRLDRLCREHLWPGVGRPVLRPAVLEGLLMGFADLVFAHADRHAVLDYKSNRLGRRASDYSADRMQQAVLDHRYDVQAALYLLALHRLLQQRMGDRYEVERHLGPAQFLFLRGIDHPDGGIVSVHPHRAWLHPLDELIGHPVGSWDGSW